MGKDIVEDAQCKADDTYIAHAYVQETQPPPLNPKGSISAEGCCCSLDTAHKFSHSHDD